MYKVNYTKLAVTKNGEVENISQGVDVAYIDCNIENIPAELHDYLRKQVKKYFPVIDRITKIKGHLIKTEQFETEGKE